MLMSALVLMMIAIDPTDPMDLCSQLDAASYPIA